jgi:hypothetical protein
MNSAYANLSTLKKILTATSVADVEAILQLLPIPRGEQAFVDSENSSPWPEGALRWVPVGLARGNAGRIKLASSAENPLAERLVNGMEALVELERHRELSVNRHAPPPDSPRAASRRYFKIRALDQISQKRSDEEWINARSMAKKLRLRLQSFRNRTGTHFTVRIEDDGIGQTPDRIHRTLLSLSESNKGDKPYLIGLFGQGGSSAFQASKAYSIVLSRRAPDLLNGDLDGVGWSIVQQIFPKGRRDPYFAYLAMSAAGEVPRFAADVADAAQVQHGTTFTHIDYDFQRKGSAVAKGLYVSLNHLLFNPVLPFELYALRDTADVMWGNAYRLTRKTRELREANNDNFIDKQFSAIRVALPEARK